MTRVTSILFLMLCSPALLAAQTRADSGRVVGEAGTVVVPAPPPEPADTALAGEPLVERTVGGAVVGAVAGGVLNAQDSDCAPSESPAKAVAFGAVWGALRSALRLNPSDNDPPLNTGDNGGVEGPFPFDGEKCAPEKP